MIEIQTSARVTNFRSWALGPWGRVMRSKVGRLIRLTPAVPLLFDVFCPVILQHFEFIELSIVLQQNFEKKWYARTLKDSKIDQKICNFTRFISERDKPNLTLWFGFKPKLILDIALAALKIIALHFKSGEKWPQNNYQVISRQKASFIAYVFSNFDILWNA